MTFKELNTEETEEVLNLLIEASFGENGFSSGDINKDNYKKYLEDRVKESKGIELEENRVPQTVYIAYIDENPVGIIKFRKKLSEYLLKRGGNVGYYIKKDERGKGYGKKMLKNFLSEIGFSSGISNFLITCNEDNIYSEKVIISNNGVLESIGEGTKRYWIKKEDIDENYYR